MPFSPHTYLTAQGWDGPGNGLRKGSIKKPVTVAHKTNTKGLGKERDTSFNWWDDVFSMVAKKGTEGAGPAAEMRKTSTGIHSPLPPSYGSASGASTPDYPPVASTSAASFNTNLIGQAKLEAARREFYGKFLRGKPITPTVKEVTDSQTTVANALQLLTSVVVEPASDKKTERAAKRAEKEERRRLRAERKEARRAKKGKGKQEAVEADEPQDGAGTSSAGAAEQSQPASPEDVQAEEPEGKTSSPAKSEKKDKKRKRERGALAEGGEDALAKRKRRKDATDVPTLPTPPPSDGEVDSAVATTPDDTAARRLAKEERKRARAGKRARKEASAAA